MNLDPVGTPPAPQIASPTVAGTVVQTFDGDAPAHATAAALALLIAGRYELREKIAEGGMGVVHAAFDRVLTREVALKMVKNLSASENTRRRFNEESRITGQLQHPAIPPVHDCGELPDGRPYLAMKLIKGRTLAQILADRAGLDYVPFLPIFEQICQAIAYAHDRHVIHRDLKPNNVMVGAFGEVQVMDWGLAKVLTNRAAKWDEDEEETRSDVSPLSDPRTGTDGSDTMTGALIGTTAFIPPEQAAGAKSQIDCRSDVFGLGAILCVILTGKPPYVGPDLKLQASRGKLDDCWRRLDACGAEGELVALAKRCLAADSADRPSDGGEVAREIAIFRRRSEERARRAELERVRSWAKSVERTNRRHWLRWLSVAIIAILAIATTVSATFGAVAHFKAADARVQKRLAQENENDAHAQSRIAKQRELEATAAGKLAETRALEARASSSEAFFRLNVSNLRLTQQAWKDGRVERMSELLNELRPERLNGEEMRGFEWHYWDRLTNIAAFTINPTSNHLRSKALQSWDFEGRAIRIRNGVPRTRNQVAYSKNGHVAIAVALRNASEIQIWSPIDHKQLHAIRLTDLPRSVVFSPDGTKLAAAIGNEAKVWDTVTMK